MTETTNQTAKYSKNYSGDVGETPKPMTGTWHLEAPDGRRWAGSCPINCVAQELAERVPVQVQLARMLAVVAEPDLDERHAKLGVEYGTGKVDDLVDKLHAEITELRAKLDALEKQGPTSITGAQALDALDELDASARGDEPYNHFATPLIRRYIEFTLAAGARPVEPAPADDVLEALALSPDQFRTESGFINQGKLRAAIRYPEKYLQPEHWMRAQPAPAEQADAKDAAITQQKGGM